MKKKWYSVGVSDVESILRTNAAYGLSRKAARSRVRRVGENNFFFITKKTALSCFKTVLSDPMLLLMIGVIAVGVIFGETALAFSCAIPVVVHVVAVFALYRISRKTIETMSGYSHPKCRIIREGSLFFVDSRSIVPGDVLLLGKGDVVPCDVRLVSASSDLSVSVFAGRRSNKQYVVSEVMCDMVYPENSNAEFYQHKNMLFAGSVVIMGEARAIAVETGKNTYIGRLDGGIPLNDNSEHPEFLLQMRGFSKMYSLAVLLMIVPLTLIGIFSYGFDSMLNTFMLTLALSVSSLGDVLYIIGNIISAASLYKCAKSANNSAMIKSPSALSKIAKTDVLVLSGSSAVCDREKKVVAVIESGKLMNDKAVVDRSVFRAAEHMQIIYRAIASYPSDVKNIISIPDEFRKYSDCLGVDTDGIAMRCAIKSLKYDNDRVNVCVSNAGISMELTLVKGGAVADIIDIEDIGSEEMLVSSERKAQIKEEIRRLESEGCEILSVCRYSLGRCIFEASFAMKNPIAPNIAKCVEHLRERGIKTVLFLESETVQNLYVARQSGIATNKSQLAYAKDNNGVLPKGDKFTVFLGFRKDKLLKYIRRQKKQGNNVTLFAIDSNLIEAFSEADVSITADRSRYSTSGYDYERLNSWIPCGTESGFDGDQVLRLNADVLVHRADLRGGGVCGIRNIIASSENIMHNINKAVSYLLSSQIMRFAVIIPAMVFGVEVLSPFQLLVGGFLIDFFGMLAYAYNFSTANGKPQKQVFDLADPLKFYKKELTVSGISALALSVVAIAISIITNKAVSGAAFISVVLTQLIMLWIGLDKKGRNASAFKGLSIIAIVLTILIFVVSIVPILSNITGMVFSLASLVCIPIAPIFYFVLRAILKKS